jgi:tetratricopeptide (TPR) repeat protein
MDIPEPDFPSSSGRPFREPDPALLDRRAEVAARASELDAEAAAELGARAWRLWMAARDIPGGREFLAEILSRPDPPRSRWRALALYGDSLFAYWQGDIDASRARNEEALAIAQENADDEALTLAHLGLSRALLEEGRHEQARGHAVAARRFASRLDGAAFGQAPLGMEAQAARAAGNYDDAAALFEQSLALNRTIGDGGMVIADLENLGLVEIRRNNVDAAERYFSQLPPGEDDYGRLNDAAVAFRRGDLERAQELLAELDEDAFSSDDRADLDWLRDQVECAAR